MSQPSKPAWGSNAKPPSSLYKAVQAEQQPNPAAASGRGGGKPSASGGRGGGGGGRRPSSGGRNSNQQQQSGGGSGRGRGGGRGGRNNQRQASQRNNPQAPGTPQQPRRKSQNHPQTPNKNKQQQQNQKNNVDSTPWEDIVLLNHTGSGTTDTQKTVLRHSIGAFMNCRMDYLDAPRTQTPFRKKRMSSTKAKQQQQQSSESKPVGADAMEGGSGDESDVFTWTPIVQCHYANKEEERLERWKADMQVLWDFKPLEINEATRWKKAEDKEGESLRRAVGILNKLSWTTLEKLTVEFLNVLGLAGDNEKKDITVDKRLIHESLSLIVQKAMEEPHFAELYARFSASLVNVHKIFKKTLLGLCQAQFEGDDAATTAESNGDTNGAETKAAAAPPPSPPTEKDPEAEYKAAIAKKKYIGLMQFIGELYKMGIIKATIMISCLEKLFVQADEEKLECFAKLMTTVGEKLDGEKGTWDHDHLEHIWQDVHSMAGRPFPGADSNNKEGPKAPSNRIKFLLQDLIDLHNSGWVESQRKQEEKAKTIAQIHKQVAMEEKQQQQQQRRPSKGKLNRSQSAGTTLSKSGSHGNLSQAGSADSASNAPQPDADGFTPVTTPKKIKQTSLRRVQSDVATSNTGGSSLQRALQNKSPKPGGQKQNAIKEVGTAPPMPPLSSEPARVVSGPTFLSPDECKKKMENLLKEYFVGGDTADAILSVDELVGVSTDTSDSKAAVDRGAAVIDAGVMLVMERKAEDVEKMLKVVKECLTATPQPKIPHASLAPGLRDALEFLRDIEIDAPLAPKHLAAIVSEFLILDVLELGFLLDAPEFFKSDGRPAEFAKQTLTSLVAKGGSISDEHVRLVTEVMTQEERSKFTDVRAWIADT